MIVNEGKVSDGWGIVLDVCGGDMERLRMGVCLRTDVIRHNG